MGQRRSFPSASQGGLRSLLNTHSPGLASGDSEPAGRREPSPETLTVARVEWQREIGQRPQSGGAVSLEGRRAQRQVPSDDHLSSAVRTQGCRSSRALTLLRGGGRHPGPGLRRLPTLQQPCSLCIRPSHCTMNLRVQGRTHSPGSACLLSEEPHCLEQSQQKGKSSLRRGQVCLAALKAV